MEMSTISPDIAPTIAALFRERLTRTPDKVAYREYSASDQAWQTSTWQEMADEVARWQVALSAEDLQPGDRVALMLKNSREWVLFDQAATGLGLVTVPLYVEDRPDNVAYIINQTESKLLLLADTVQWQALASSEEKISGVQRVVCLAASDGDGADGHADGAVTTLAQWLSGAGGGSDSGERSELQSYAADPQQLATIVYTSGTTGRPKGVMLSHKNVLANAWAGLQCANVNSRDIFLSFLPLTHTLERTIGYLLPMMLGAQVAYARSIPQLGEDLLSVRPTAMVSVPRIYEKVYGKIQAGLKEKSAVAQKLFAMTQTVGWSRFEYEQKRGPWSASLLLWPLLNKVVASKVLEKLGGRLRVAICGGAALSPDVGRLFIALGTPLIQGYGLTEASPVVSVNRPDDNIPSSIGTPLPGVEVRIGANDELQTRSDCVMMGYWNNDEATQASFTGDGWLRSGDKARIDADDGHIYITGRLKEIIVLANGEKVPPADMDTAITLDSLFEQAVVIGEARPYLSALLVVNPEQWQMLAATLGLDADDPASLRDKKALDAAVSRIGKCLHNFPGYAQIRNVTLCLEPWTVENGLLTPTLKVKRNKVMEQYSAAIDTMYSGHSV
ncbi:MAG: long-chain fatty acid--CoA ligase [Gammaproteobacteria bacterium]|nr:long-chain fatty acid--CoA ligase [Gammaproteobacteria bacterium]